MQDNQRDEEDSVSSDNSSSSSSYSTAPDLLDTNNNQSDKRLVQKNFSKLVSIQQNHQNKDEEKFDLSSQFDPTQSHGTQLFICGENPSSGKARRFLKGKVELYRFYKYQQNKVQACTTYLQFFTNIYEEMISQKFKITSSSSDQLNLDLDIAQELYRISRGKQLQKYQFMQNQIQQLKNKQISSNLDISDLEQGGKQQDIIQRIFFITLNQVKSSQLSGFTQAFQLLLKQVPFNGLGQESKNLIKLDKMDAQSIMSLEGKIANITQCPQTLTNLLNFGPKIQPSWQYFKATQQMIQNYDYMFLYTQYLLVLSQVCLATLSSIRVIDGKALDFQQLCKNKLSQIQEFKIQKIEPIILFDSNIRVYGINTYKQWVDLPTPLGLNIGLVMDDNPVYYRSICKAIEYILSKATHQSQVSDFLNTMQDKKQANLVKYLKKLEHCQHTASKNHLQLKCLQEQYDKQQIKYQEKEDQSLYIGALIILYQRLTIQYRVVDITENNLEKKYYLGDFVYPLNASTHIGYLLHTQDDMNQVLEQVSKEKGNSQQNTVSWNLGVDYWVNAEISGQHDQGQSTSTNQQVSVTSLEIWNQYIGLDLNQNEGIYILNMEDTQWYVVIKQDTKGNAKIIKFLKKSLVRSFMNKFKRLSLDNLPNSQKEQLLSMKIVERKAFQSFNFIL